jgi:hypothetical protein
MRSWSTLFAVGLAVALALPAAADVVYETNFDDLTLGQTENPPLPGHDGWYMERAQGEAFGEIQDFEAKPLPGQALRQFAPASNGPGNQTIDRRAVDPAIEINDVITISFDYFCNSSDYAAANIYEAVFSVWDTTHPGYLIAKLKFEGGNGVPKSDTGVSLTLYAWNGIDNNEYIFLDVGQNLAWDEWHSIELVIDYPNDQYVSVTVDGETEDLSMYQPERSWPEFQLGTHISRLEAQVIPWPWDDPDISDDNVIWDNLSITLGSVQPDCPGDLNGDGLRDQSDLGILLASYGVDDGGDIDGDGDTDQSDLGILLANYGIDCD